MFSPIVQKKPDNQRFLGCRYQGSYQEYYQAYYQVYLSRDEFFQQFQQFVEKTYDAKTLKSAIIRCFLELLMLYKF